MIEETLPLEHGTLHFLRGGDGPLIVFSHALGPLAWGPLERLRGSCTVVIPDWERSTAPIRTMAELDWFEALTDSLGFSQAALCAWSMAGPAAIHYAAEKPQNLSHLILVDVAGLGSSLPPLRFRDLPHLALTRLRGHPTRGLVRTMWRNWVHREDIDTRPLVEATYRFFRDTAGALDDPTDDDDPEDDGDTVLLVLPDVEVPTLVLSGRHSTVLGPRYGRTAAAVLPHGEHIVFEGSSHTLQLEEPDKFQDALVAFVTKSSSLQEDDVQSFIEGWDKDSIDGTELLTALRKAHPDTTDDEARTALETAARGRPCAASACAAAALCVMERLGDPLDTAARIYNETDEPPTEPQWFLWIAGYTYNWIVNGGLSSCYFDFDEEQFADRVRVYDAIGAKTAADVMRAADRAFGEEGAPASHDERVAACTDATRARLEELSPQFWACRDEIFTQAFLYALEHADDFRES